MDTVEIVEVGPRDGLQNEGSVLSHPVRAELVHRLLGAGLRRIEVCSFVDPRRVPQMAGAEELLASLSHPPDARFIGLVLNRRGFERAVDSGVDEVNVVVVATETFSQRNQGMSVRTAIDNWLAISESARAAGIPATVTISSAFGCPFEGRVAPERVLELAELVAEGAPTELGIADTIGAAVPSQVSEIIGLLGDRLPGYPLRAHFHNTRNTGYANAVAAVQSGVTSIDASLGGIGGCPFAPQSTGNIATEDLAWMLTEMGYQVGVDIDRTVEATRWIADQLGVHTPAFQGHVPQFPIG